MEGRTGGHGMAWCGGQRQTEGGHESLLTCDRTELKRSKGDPCRTREKVNERRSRKDERKGWEGGTLKKVKGSG